MPCYHPLKAFSIGYNANGKRKFKITSHDIKWIRWNGNNWILYKDGNPYGDYINESIDIPCGKCIGCRLDYSRQWADRCMLELNDHNSAYFLTLTYDNSHLPTNDYIDAWTGEIKQSPVHTLVKKDLQDFMKRLRKNTGQSLRYFACGEYGDKTFRPHYHLIVFGLELDDLRLYKVNYRGEPYYNSSMIEKCWKFGHSVVADVTWDTCAYVARYVVKKLKGEPAVAYEYLNIVPPFVLMSRRPGIARNYYDNHRDEIYKYDNIVMSTNKGGRTIRPPRYYDKLYDVDYPDDMGRIKELRSFVADNIKKSKLSQTDLSYDELLSIEEDNLLSRLGYVLERSGINEEE